MPVRKRIDKRRAALDAHEEAWLCGEGDSGFVQFMHPADLEALWQTYGDKTALHWDRSMARPVLLL